MGHADEVTTDVDTRRVFASERDGVVSIGWDYPGRTLLDVRILRSSSGFAAGPEPGAGQLVAYEDVTGSFRDAPPSRDEARYYTVFARHPGREWRRWGEFLSRREADKRARRGWGRLAGKAWRRRLGPLVLALLCLAALAAAVPARSAAAATSKEREAARSQAEAAAAADPLVAAVLAAGTAPAPRADDWPNGAGTTLTYEWTRSHSVAVAAVWPLVKTRGAAEVPVAPYTQYERRLRIDTLTGLRVDVLYRGDRVIQLMPVDAATQFDLREQTWPPFSWSPWFTAHPWAPVPLFLAIGIVVILRSWLRSRAWNRRLPSMTRHDRQFMGRLAVTVFLLAGLAWQVYEGVVAATGPTADPSAVWAGDLASLPVLLIPPALFLAALVLELSWQPHRVAWALVAVLAVLGSAYGLATALTATTTNLDLTYYLLLAVLALVAIPRAFSRGKTGWSRGFSPHYG